MPKLNIPNTLTLSRICIVPVIVTLLYFPSKVNCFLAAFCFVLASISDFLDGYLARYGNQVTSFGKFLDPLADKLLTCSMLIMLVNLQWVAAWIVIIIICRELFITGLRAIAADSGVVIAADKWGKLKTVTQGLALLPLTLHYPIFGYDPHPIGELLLYMALALTVFSGVNYVYGFYSAWRGNIVK